MSSLILGLSPLTPWWYRLQVPVSAVIVAIVIVVAGIVVIAVRKRFARWVAARRPNTDGEGAKAYRFQRLTRDLLVLGIVLIVVGLGFGVTSFRF